MKKRGIIIVLLGTMMILNTAFASLPQEFFQHRWRTTPLIGISGGYAVRDGHITSSILYGNNPDTSATLVRDYSDNGLIYGILVGFQGFLHPWLLGIEVNLEWQDIDSPHAYAFSDIHGQFGWNASTTYRRETVVGLTGRVGYIFTPDVMPYFRFGAEVGRDKLATRFFGTNAFPISVAIDSKVWVYRFLIGAGLEIPVPCSSIVLRLEYDVHSKGKTVETNGAYTDGVINPVFNCQMQPLTQSGSIALVHYFY